VLSAIERIAHPEMGNLGWRHITVSTVGIVPGIDTLAASNIPVHLALSLHAPDDATRSRIVPMNRRWPVAEILAAARRYQSTTGRIVNIEYCMLAGVNDSLDQANLLADLMHGFPAHVNLIPHNPIGLGISGVEYRRPDPHRVEQFAALLRESGAVTHIRIARGDDVAAACGQLRETTAAIA
jgi:23S rRNA (adenine2503-C2)-methyltransferase